MSRASRASITAEVLVRLSCAGFRRRRDSLGRGLADARLDSGARADVVSELTGLVQSHPLRERFHSQLIVALYRCGRQADALRAYQRARSTLLDELGVDPGPELRSLESAVACGSSRPVDRVNA